jgi:DNA primase
VVNRDPLEWERILENARPIVVHVMETLAAGRNLEDPKIKNEIANQVLPLIEDVPSPIERDTYRQRLARLLRVDERTLLEGGLPSGRSRPALRRRPGRRTSAEARPELLPAAKVGYAMEMHCLGVLLRRPDLLYKVDRALQEDGLSRLLPEDFQHTDHQSIFRLLHESVDQDMAEPLNYVLSSLSLSLMELADGLLEFTTRLDPNEERVLEDLLRALLDLRKRNLRQNNEYIRFMMEEAQQQGDFKATQYREIMVQNSRILDRLNRALGKYTSHSIPAR